MDLKLVALRDRAISILSEMQQLRTDVESYNQFNKSSAFIDVEGVQPMKEIVEMKRFIKRANEHLAELAQE